MNWLRDSFIILGIACVAMVIAMLVTGGSGEAGAFAAGAVGVGGAIWFAYRGFRDDIDARAREGR